MHTYKMQTVQSRYCSLALLIKVVTVRDSLTLRVKVREGYNNIQQCKRTLIRAEIQMFTDISHFISTKREDAENEILFGLYFF